MYSSWRRESSATDIGYQIMDLRNNGTTKNDMENDKRTNNECQSREIFSPSCCWIPSSAGGGRLVAWGLNLKIWISCSDFLLPQSGKETKKEEKDRKGEGVGNMRNCDGFLFQYPRGEDGARCAKGQFGECSPGWGLVWFNFSGPNITSLVSGYRNA